MRPWRARHLPCRRPRRRHQAKINRAYGPRVLECLHTTQVLETYYVPNVVVLQ